MKTETLNYDIVVIGAGAAGCMAAYTAAQGGARVALLERRHEILSKVLLSGGGRCNFSRRMQVDELISHYPESRKFLCPSFSALDTRSIERLFSSWGVKVSCEGADERLYCAEGAKSLQAAFQRELGKLRVNCLVQAKVYDITQLDGEYPYQLHIYQQDRKLSLVARQLICATGGVSYPQTGSDGLLHKLLEHKGIRLTGLCAGLVALPLAAHDKIQSLAGLTLERVRLSVYRSSDDLAYTSGAAALFVANSDGPFLYTHKGISGRSVLDISRWVTRYEARELLVDFVPKAEEEFLGIHQQDKKMRVYPKDKGQIQRWFEELMHTQPLLTTSQLYRFQLPEKLRRHLVAQAKLEWGVKLSSLGLPSCVRLYQRFHSYPLQLECPHIERAAVTVGGVALSEVHAGTLELKKFPGMYIAGELLDIDGNCGGYNLSAAWATGFLAGISAVKKMKSEI